MNKYARTGVILSFTGSIFVMMAFGGLFVHDHHNYQLAASKEQEIARLESLNDSLQSPQLGKAIHDTIYQQKNFTDTIHINHYINTADKSCEKSLIASQDSIRLLTRTIIEYQRKLAQCEKAIKGKANESLPEVLQNLCTINNNKDWSGYENESWFKAWHIMLPPQELRGFCKEFGPYIKIK